MDFVQGIVVFCLLCEIHNVQGQQPYINPSVPSWNLFEYAKDDYRLGCLTCTHGEAIKMSIVSVSVTRGAASRCTSCFNLRKLLNTAYCLYYSSNTVANPNEYLDYASSQEYEVKIECTDGTLRSEVNVDVPVIPNSAPVFSGPPTVTCPSPIDAVTTPAFSYVYTSVAATDSNDDVIIYSMTSDPVNDIFDIEPSTGRIYTKRPVSNFCNNDVIFYVSATDNTTASLGTLTVTCYIDNYYDSPVVSNAVADVDVDENSPVDTMIYRFLTSTPSIPVVYSISSVLPASAARLFKIAGDELQVAAPLNFERDSRNPEVTITVDNGYCPPSEYVMDVHIQDTNDAPEVIPNIYSFADFEGSVLSIDLVNILTFSVTDEDAETVFDYSITAGDPLGLWSLSGTTLISTVTWDYETHGPGSTLTIQVADRGGPAYGTVTVVVIVADVDDNPPVMSASTIPTSIPDCTLAGSVLGTLASTDADSSANGNDLFVFDVVVDTDIAVNAAGEVYTINNVTVGSTYNLTVGTYSVVTPATTSSTSATVTVTVTTCSLEEAGITCNAGVTVLSLTTNVVVLALSVINLC